MRIVDDGIAARARQRARLLQGLGGLHGQVFWSDHGAGPQGNVRAGEKSRSGRGKIKRGGRECGPALLAEILGPGAPSNVQQPSTARIRSASVTNKAASVIGIIFPACARVSLMKSCSFVHAVTTSPTLAAASAALSFALRLVAIPLGKPRPPTVSSRLASWAGASSTVTRNVARAWLPLGSVAIHVTPVVPIAKPLDRKSTRLNSSH